MILRYMKPYRARVILGTSIKMSGAILELLLPLILAHIVDQVAPLGDVRQIVLWGGIMMLAAILAWLANITANRMASYVAAECVRHIRRDLFIRSMELSGRQVDHFTIPSLESRMTTDTYNIHRFIGMIQRLGVRAPMLFIGGIIFCFIQEWRLALILLFLLPPIAVFLFYISKSSFPRFRKLQKNIDQMIRILRENIRGIKVTKALDKTEYEKAHFAESNQAVQDAEVRANLWMALTHPVIDVVLNMGLTAVLILGGLMVHRGMTLPGVIIAFLSYFIQITNSLLSLNRMFMMYNRSSASSARISEVLEVEEASEQKITPVHHTDIEPASPAIEFDQVSFSYGGDLALRDISFRLEHGASLGIIGSTGSGKSTLIHLLLRHYDVTDGQIMIHGRPIQAIPLHELHQMFGIVYQNDFLYEDTIRNNIDFGRGYDDDQLLQAASSAQAMEFIEEKEGGLDFKLASKGVNLSGGQKQRVLLSRALAGSPEILILDDSSSALDFATEAKLRHALSTHYDETTSIIIAQRISAIQHCDQILMLDGGQNVGYGTHEELMATNTLYREIAEQQMGVTA